MSIQIHINVSELDMPTSHDAGIIRCVTQFELSKWVEWHQEAEALFLWHQHRVEARPCDIDVEFLSVNRLEKYPMKDCDPTMVCLSRALEWKDPMLLLFQPGWNPQAIIRARAAKAFLEQLPDDWPLVLFIV
jgi:hypothetical protein